MINYLIPMPKKRRKLSADMEKQIASAKRKVELVTAIIGDIEEEDIQGDYRLAFEKISDKTSMPLRPRRELGS